MKFEDWLVDKHADGYTGLDDDMVDDFYDWVEEEWDSLIDLAEDWLHEENIKLIQSINNIFSNLCTNTKKVKSSDSYQAYIEGVIDMYNEVKKEIDNG